MKLRACLIGASKTGKSHFISKLKNYHFTTYKSTIGVDFCTYKKGEDRISIWDTSGSDNFRSITYNFVHSVNILMCMYNSKESAEWLQNYLDTLENDSIEKIIFIYHDVMHEINTKIENHSIACTFTRKNIQDCIDFIIKINKKEKQRSYCFW